jgi:dUTP pyrophosphatase
VQKDMAVTVRFTGKPGSFVPEYKTPGSAGSDLCALLDEPVVIKPLERQLIPTGISIELPAGYEMQIRPRSGLALKYGITVLNSPGTIDSDYRGEIGIVLVNLGSEPFEVRSGDRIAQAVVSSVEQCIFVRVDEISSTSRGAGGYGSTGKN